MSQPTTVNLSDSLVQALDSVAKDLCCSRADVICMAVKNYLEEHDDALISLDRLEDRNDPVLDWDDVKRGFLDKDCKKLESLND